jgi:predicted O-methyltransferase YrrM
VLKGLWQKIGGRPAASRYAARQFRREFRHNLRSCKWEPHPLHSVFTQYDQEYYLKQKEAFLHKYRCFYAVSRTISPRKIIELGTCAGSGADAYLNAAPDAEYLGIDVFGENIRHDDQSPWKPYEVARQLFEARGYTNCQLLRVDLRTLDKLPSEADLVVVDAAHDFNNEYADLKLALTANPTFIFVDDANDEHHAKPAIEKFLEQDVKQLVNYIVSIDYPDGGLVINLRK